MGKERCVESGVTLIEMLIVLVLISVAAGIVTFALPGQAPPHAVSQEADLLSARLNLAAERSLTGGQHVRMSWQEDGYQFQIWNGERWFASKVPMFAKPHQLENGITLRDLADRRSGEIRITSDLMPMDAADQLVLQLVSGSSRRDVLFDGARARVSP